MIDAYLKRIYNIKNHIVKEYYGGTNEESQKFLDLLDEYRDEIEVIKSEYGEAEAELSSRILLGSSFMLKSLDEEIFASCQLVMPFYSGKNKDIKDISFVSPIGRAILLKKMGDEMLVDSPFKEYNFKIGKIDPLKDNIY